MGENISSQFVFIQNNIPIIEEAIILPLGPNENDILKADFGDLSIEGENTQIKWFINNQLPECNSLEEDLEIDSQGNISLPEPKIYNEGGQPQSRIPLDTYLLHETDIFSKVKDQHEKYMDQILEFWKESRDLNLIDPDDD